MSILSAWVWLSVGVLVGMVTMAILQVLRGEQGE